MQLKAEFIERCSDDPTEFLPWLERVGGRVLELGCGAAQNARRIAEHPRVESVLGLERDEIQHTKNLSAPPVPKLRFVLGGAEAIPAGDACFDMVFMFKSLHHVPANQLDHALAEVHRVLRPGGIAYVSEPIFAGPLSEVLVLFHDESKVRLLAFEALVRAAGSGSFELLEELFFVQRRVFEDFAAFEREVINVTHTEHRLGDETMHAIRGRFDSQLSATGGEFHAPQRIDILRRV